MASQSERLERQSRQTRARLSETIEALRGRMTAGQVIDQVAEYARSGAQHGPVADFFRNLGREVRDNPLPLTLIAIGVAWLVVATSLSRRARRQVYVIERDRAQAAEGAQDGEVDWASSRVPNAPAMEQADG